MHKVVNFLDIKVDNLTMQESIKFIEESIADNRKIIREDINAAKVVWIQKDKILKEIINRADIVNADGQSVVLASKFLKNPIKERVTGIDLMQKLLAISAKRGWGVYLLGATQDVLQEATRNIEKEYSSSIIAGYHNGYFSQNDEDKIVDIINSSNAKILFVGISTPKKEQFILRNYNRLNVNLLMGVGGSFDIIAKKVKRAPLFMQKSGLEWLYRLYQEPKKMWRRYLYTNTLFILIVGRRVIKNLLQ